MLVILFCKGFEDSGKVNMLPLVIQVSCCDIVNDIRFEVPYSGRLKADFLFGRSSMSLQS
jgi:hypothetical protein